MLESASSCARRSFASRDLSPRVNLAMIENVFQNMWFGHLTVTAWRNAEPVVTPALRKPERSNSASLNRNQAAWQRRGPKDRDKAFQSKDTRDIVTAVTAMMIWHTEPGGRLISTCETCPALYHSMQCNTEAMPACEKAQQLRWRGKCKENEQQAIPTWMAQKQFTVSCIVVTM